MTEQTGSHPDLQHMRQVLGHVPTSVCVVTTVVDGEPAGSVVGTFTSVSLDPPLIAFFSQTTSDTLAAVCQAGTFTVNVLAADQSSICGVFAKKATARFDRVPWRAGGRGTPHLEGALAVLECDVETTSQVGDHIMVIGRVVELDQLRSATSPLVFWTGALHGLQNSPPDHPYYRAQLGI